MATRELGSIADRKGRSQMSGSYHGREKELEQLQGLFRKVVGGEGPKMAVILAHTGVGKTRLAQEFYRWLAASSKWNASGFWPKDLGEVGQSLRVNPDLPPRASVKP
ncbi:MAG: ATP-binding protein, partial [Deltaproteobacteria bacterium]|nr:ATP-binding protein [Deltaproteobacteria bacterium]